MICINSMPRHTFELSKRFFMQAIYPCFQTSQYFLTNCMKSKPQKVKQHSHASSQLGDCSCEMLDTSLSDVGESDCSCSECLEANLQAFNELKQMEQDEEREKQEQGTKQRGISTRPMSNKQTRQVSRNAGTENTSTAKVGDFKSVDKMRHTRPKTSKFQQDHHPSQAYENGESEFPKFSRECLNDYMKITRNRVREFLNKRKGLQRSEMEKRNELKKLIKENLQALKYTAKNLVVSKLEESKNSRNDGHSYGWNHTPYHCRSRVQCRKLKKYSPNLEEKKQEIQAIKQRIKKYKEETKEKPYQCPDQCPRHHMRTSKKKMIEIEKFIMKNAKAYQEEHQKKKIEKMEAQKVKEAKLRAIDLKCKEKVTRSKKYDPTDQKTSFHNSIDHFSTFSQLRLNNHQRLQQKKKRKKLKEALKDGKQLQQAIYENLQDQLISDHPPIHSKINIQSRYVQGQPQEEQWCEKIVKDARIKPPKDIKKDDKELKKIKEKKKMEEERQQKNTKKSVKHLSTKDLKKEEERRKEIQIEIQRKKQEILNQYQKRNTTKNDPKNRQLREQYEDQLKQETRPRNKQIPNPKNNQTSDPFRQAYKHHPNNDEKQMRVIGDPLLEEYQYHQKTKQAQQLQTSSPVNRQLFTASGKQLMQKKILKV